MKKYLLIVLTSLALGCKSGSNDAIEIKLKLPKGAKYEYALEMDMNMKQKMMEKDMDIKNSMGYSYLLEVLNDSANWKTVSCIIHKINMSMNAMGRTMHFDSEEITDTTGPMGIMAKIFGAMKGSKFSFTVNDNGEIGEMSGVKAMQEKMLAGIGIPNTAEALEGLKNTIDDESLRENMQQAFAAYPGKPVKPGDSWTKALVQKTQGITIKLDNTYTLESVKGNDALIKLSSKLNSGGPATVNNTEMNITGTSEGNIHYDLTTGMMTTGNIDMKMDMKVKTAQTEMPMIVNMKITTKGKKI
ncbi:MAG TPA: DUF6263 family protein [Chitinophagaceae bacterium]|jgi:hypothetical protein|nr:DUF6263 family protein [Chitinophagaceae bacterium]